MVEKDHLKFTREELYNLVWAKPMIEVAKDFQISDRAMAKMCARKQVPVPPRGYWARKSAGQNVAQPLLPVFVAKAPKEKKQEIPPPQPPAKKPKLRSMLDERAQTIKKGLKELRSALSEGIEYGVRIESWNCDYSFGLNTTYDPLRRDDDISFLYESPYSEYRDLVLKGVFLEPPKLKEQKFEARFTRRHHLDEKFIDENLHRYEESPPKSVGAFVKQGHAITGFLAIPEDAFALVFQNVVANKIKFMTLRGQKLRYGRGQIYQYSLEEEKDEEPVPRITREVANEYKSVMVYASYLLGHIDGSDVSAMNGTATCALPSGRV
jgi:hypothetical protein